MTREEQRRQMAISLLIVRNEMRHVLNCDGWRAPNHIVYEIAANRMRNRTLLRYQNDSFSMSEYLHKKSLMWKDRK